MNHKRRTQGYEDEITSIRMAFGNVAMDGLWDSLLDARSARGQAGALDGANQSNPGDETSIGKNDVSIKFIE